MMDFRFAANISMLSACIFMLAYLIAPQAIAQDNQSYFVYLNRKGEATESFITQFHPNAINRRVTNGLRFPDYQDLPFFECDVQAIRQRVDSVRYQLRWVGAVTVNANEAQVNSLLKLPFVDRVEAMGCYESVLAELPDDLPARDTTKQRKLFGMIRELMSLDTLKNRGLTGKGVTIAVLDAGFREVNTHPAFEAVRTEGRILKTNDFYGGKGEDVYYGSKHGTGVLGCIAGNSPYGVIGAGYGANFLLARTEHDNKEKPIEEDHWMAAAEWADMNGAEIISSSLGYAARRYKPAQMDGKTAPVTIAASIAVRKGMLVVNSAGNEGGSKFRTIAAPADADSVLSVGASYPMIRYVMPFSSVGPNARGIIKPEISAPGYVLTAGMNGGYVEMPGTSFACPLVAGVAACLKEANPKLSNMKIRDQIIRAGHFYPYFDAALGFGVLDAKYLFNSQPVVEPTFQLGFLNDTLWVIPNDSLLKLKTESSSNGKPIHMSNLDNNGRLIAYSQRRLGPGDRRVYVPEPHKNTQKLRIWWEGYLYEVTK